MAIPAGFNEIEQLQMLIRRYVNRAVREDFTDLNNSSGAWEPDVSTVRGAMRHALTHKDADPINVTLLRLFLYYFTYGKARALQPPIYGIPVAEYDRSYKYKPQIHLHFYQSRFNTSGFTNNDEVSSKPVESTVSFRLMNETSESLTMTELERYASRIKAGFGTSGGYRWHKGKTRVNYYDIERGYRLSILCRAKADGRALIEQLLDIQQHTPDWTKMTTTENEEPLEAYPNVPSPRTRRILSKQVQTPIERPVVEVRYKYSTIHIHGLGQPKGLHDLTRTMRSPVIA